MLSERSAALLAENRFNLSEVPGPKFELRKVSAHRGDPDDRDLRQGFVYLFFYHVTRTDI